MGSSLTIGQLKSELTAEELLTNVNTVQIANSVYEVLSLIGVSGLNRKRSKVDIKDHVGVMPKGFISVKSIEHNGTPMIEMTSYREEDADDNEYRIVGGSIHTSFKDGIVDVVYEAMDVDDEGMPLIPDDIELIRAIKAYVRMNVVRGKVYVGKIHPSILAMAQQEYAWAIGQASRKKLSVDGMEAVLKAGRQGPDWHRRKFK